MSKTNKIIIVALSVSVLLLGIGYAAIQSVTLNISGTAVADPSQSNFKVMFSGIPEVSDSTYVTAGITDDINAIINVNGLTTNGETVRANYTVQNVSTDLSVDLSVATTNSNTEYFTISSELAKTSLIAGEATTVTVTVEVTKTPLAESVSSTIGVQLTATPVQPGEEGTSGATNDYSQTPQPTLASVTNANIGDYIDLGNNIIGTESTSDDWRILYKDGDTIYAILADYLPAEQVPETAGLNTKLTTYPYSVWASNRDTLLKGLLNTTAWSDLTNGIEGALATGSPTAELLMSSYNTQNGTELVYTDLPTLDSETVNYDLYVPHTKAFRQCGGYWLASPSSPGYIWNVGFGGYVDDCKAYNYSNLGVRPVVSILSRIVAELVDGVWVVLQNN